ncbi:short chain dehydrogenase [Aquimarina gracilis]|uniref:Short chain dehydrogenase n=1 Tax=Aquimarina gracilis TaxID=874422 RepID=A0ABU5ZXE5_9FLAO|nr:short chain dehydrogenase [Aquimarina gracilis]MEB3346541.1 short chain dehydrogenase [Aquimarina gracilis]
MKILIIGATGTIGSKIYQSLKNDGYEVYGAHRNNQEYPVDITDKQSINLLFQKLPKLDAVINAAGTASWKTLSELTEDDYYLGIQSKLMGQVNLVHIAKEHLVDNGSITLTTGILAEHYEPNAVALSLVNGGIHSFVNSASNELDRGIRLNVVAPGAIAGDFPTDKKFAGYYPIVIEEAIKLYKQTLTEKITGQILKKY